MQKLQTNKIKQIVDLFKGVNSELFDSLIPEKRNFLAQKTIKELCILAESNKSGAGKLLLDHLYENNKLDLFEIESIIEYGKHFKDLTNKEKKYVKRLEIQQEFGHFSRIMNLDGLINDKNVSAEENALDFSRFIELLAERNQDRNIKSSSNWARPENSITHHVNNTLACGILEPTPEENTAALLAVKEPIDNFHPKFWLKEFNKLINRLEPKVATLTFDYLLYLNNVEADISFVVTHINKYEPDIVELIGAGGCGILITSPRKDNFYKVDVIGKYTIGNEDWGFGKFDQTKIEFLKIDGINPNTKVYLMHPNAWAILKGMDENEIAEVLNMPQKNGWFNAHNALTAYLTAKGVISQVVSLRKKPNTKKVTNEKVNPDVLVKNLVETEKFQALTKANSILLEVAHIHADRLPGEEQWECVRFTKALIKQLNKGGFKGKIDMMTMIDEYHVMNRLDYKKYLQDLEKRGVNVDEVVMESSPLVRIIAIEILQYLAENPSTDGSYRVFEKGDNLYLEFTEKKAIIELLADVNNKPVIGCVLFDVALCLYKLHRNYYSKKYNKVLGLEQNENVHEVLLNYYKKVKDINKRRAFMESFFVEIPKWKELRAKRGRISFPKSETTLVNILAYFYKPQQKKVNMFLAILGQKPLYTLFYNTKSEKIELVNEGNSSA